MCHVETAVREAPTVRLSARNQLKDTVTAIKEGAVEVTGHERRWRADAGGGCHDERCR